MSHADKCRFEDVYYDLPKNGWLSKPEAELLWRIAGGVSGPILEVGCYYGRSTCLLAALGRSVHSVDPFTGFDDGDPSGDAIHAAFLANLAERNLTDVTWYRQRIEDWTPPEATTFGFAYLDGDHTYEGTKSQIKAALAAGVRRIAVHDVNDDGEGAAVKRACMIQFGGEWVERVERLAYWEVK